MHIIDREWSYLAAGYQAIQSLQTRLESEFGRAVQAGHKEKFRREISEWEKKRRVLFALAAIAPLSIITLCLAAYYFREVACVIVYWVILVLIILVTLAVAAIISMRQ
jgi:small-conductance mechanosensitive channel